MKRKMMLPLVLILSLSLGHSVFAQDSAKIDVKRKQMVEKMDKTGLLARNEAVIINNIEVLSIPNTVTHLKDLFTVAAEAPVIELVIIPIQERYQLDPPAEFHRTVWSSWGQGVYSEKTQTYYAAYGNHRLSEARIFIAEYDTKSRTIKNSPEINQALGRKLPQGFGDGKIHGWLDLYKDEIFFCTYWAHYPRPLEEHYRMGYDGGHVASYNPGTREVTDFGLPMPRASWPYHRFDSKRGLMFAVGMFGEFICFDINEKKVRFAGFPPEGIVWNKRTMLLDDKTGFVYSTNNSALDSMAHFIKYDPVSNQFSKMNSALLPNIESGNLDQMRAHTKKRSKDGWFIGVTRQMGDKPAGQLFKFYPDEDRVENMGICWPGIQSYTTSLALSPDEKYLYYLPGAHGRSHLEGSPVVQYNVQTGERKVLAFLFPYLTEKFGYVPGGSFSISIDDEGKRLFVCLNGTFTDYDKVDQDIFGDPSVLVIHIPETERQ